MAGSRLETVGSIFSRCVRGAVVGRGCLPRAGALSLGGCEQGEAFFGVRSLSRGAGPPVLSPASELYWTTSLLELLIFHAPVPAPIGGLGRGREEEADGLGWAFACDVTGMGRGAGTHTRRWKDLTPSLARLVWNMEIPYLQEGRAAAMPPFRFCVADSVIPLMPQTGVRLIPGLGRQL